MAHKLNFLQPGSGLDLLKRDRPPQRFDRCKVHGVPVAFFGGWIGISSSRNLGDADNGFVFSAMIEEDFVALSHPAQIIPCRVVSNACPIGLALGRKVGPRVGRRFLFYQPEIFHVQIVTQASSLSRRAGILPAQEVRLEARLIHMQDA